MKGREEEKKEKRKGVEPSTVKNTNFVEQVHLPLV